MGTPDVALLVADPTLGGASDLPLRGVYVSLKRQGRLRGEDADGSPRSPATSFASPRAGSYEL